MTPPKRCAIGVLINFEKVINNFTCIFVVY